MKLKERRVARTFPVSHLFKGRSRENTRMEDWSTSQRAKARAICTNRVRVKKKGKKVKAKITTPFTDISCHP